MPEETKSYCWAQEGSDECHFGFGTIAEAEHDIRLYADPIDGDGPNKYFIYEAKPINPLSLMDASDLLDKIGDYYEEESPLEESWSMFLELTGGAELKSWQSNDTDKALTAALAATYAEFAKEHNLPTWYTTDSVPVAEVIPG